MQQAATDEGQPGIVTADIPATRSPDSTLAMLREGYEFIGRRCRHYGTDAFRTWLMLSDVICIRGSKAAETFYGNGLFGRRRSMPHQESGSSRTSSGRSGFGGGRSTAIASSRKAAADGRAV